MSKLVKREAYSVEKHRIDRVWRNSPSQIESSIHERIAGVVPATQVAIRLFNEQYTVVVYMEKGAPMVLTFDQSHIPAIIKPEHVKLIGDGILMAYQERNVGQPQHPQLK